MPSEARKRGRAFARRLFGIKSKGGNSETESSCGDTPCELSIYEKLEFLENAVARYKEGQQHLERTFEILENRTRILNAKLRSTDILLEREERKSFKLRGIIKRFVTSKFDFCITEEETEELLSLIEEIED